MNKSGTRYSKNKEYFKEHSKNYKLENSEKCKAQGKRYYEENKERIKERVAKRAIVKKAEKQQEIEELRLFIIEMIKNTKNNFDYHGDENDEICFDEECRGCAYEKKFREMINEKH